MGDRVAARRNYEREVRALTDRAVALRAEGWNAERIARDLVYRRNALKLKYRAGDDPAVVMLLEARNRARYGDPVGPSPDQLLGRYGSWEEVIAAAARPARPADG